MLIQYKNVKNAKINAAGLKLIQYAEGLRTKMYKCPGGQCTIGYGHRVKASEKEAFTKGITEAAAIKLLREDIAWAELAVSNNVKVKLNSNQFSALVSFVFNLGTTNFKQSTLLKLLNNGSYQSVPKQLNRWVFAKKKKLLGLQRRRYIEGKLFAATDAGERIVQELLARWTNSSLLNPARQDPALSC